MLSLNIKQKTWWLLIIQSGGHTSVEIMQQLQNRLRLVFLRDPYTYVVYVCVTTFQYDDASKNNSLLVSYPTTQKQDCMLHVCNPVETAFNNFYMYLAPWGETTGVKRVSDARKGSLKIVASKFHNFLAHAACNSKFSVKVTLPSDPKLDPSFTRRKKPTRRY